MKGVFILLLAAASAAWATFWMENIAHHGIAPFNPDKSYAIFRNVKDFGAKGDGCKNTWYQQIFKDLLLTSPKRLTIQLPSMVPSARESVAAVIVASGLPLHRPLFTFLLAPTSSLARSSTSTTLRLLETPTTCQPSRLLPAFQLMRLLCSMVIII